MNKKNAFDLPTRVFHWVFAILFVAAFTIANTIDDDSKWYTLHSLSGIMMVFLIFLRGIWGFVGSKYARFSSFKLNPSDLIKYLKSIFSSKTKRDLGHNPASSYAAILMFIFTIGLGATGILMSKGINKHFFEEVHELCANGFIFTVIAHIVGVVFHQVKHKDGLAFAMTSGKKEEVDGQQEIASNHPFIAIVFIGLFTSFGIYLNNNFERDTQKLNLFGSSIELGEDEHSQSGRHSSRKRDHDDDHDDD
ncbi:MAG: cytochrome b [Bacteriovoracaceae bacterium]|nr:cytochrome b [Bacteriovoracaceae bacterium]